MLLRNFLQELDELKTSNVVKNWRTQQEIRPIWYKSPSISRPPVFGELNMGSMMEKAIADYIHAVKYAKYLPELNRRETYEETIDRVKAMHKSRFPKLSKEIDDAFGYVYKKIVLPSMRSMQFAGDPIFKHNARMYNCCFTLIDRPRVFGEILYLLLCGCGVGYSVQLQHVRQLPQIKLINKNLVCHHTITDSMEGWADAVNSLINGVINGYYVEFRYDMIRPVGSQISSRGKAPGHLDLKSSLESIRLILSGAANRKLRPIECHDIICHLSKAVVAGGTRAGSLISLFSMNDEEMLLSKDSSNFNFTSKNSQRSLANNSVVLDKNCGKHDFNRIISLNRKNFGDPGFIFLDNKACGVNPCGEVGIYPKDDSGNTGFGFCNLVEINAAACNNLEFYEAAKAASFIATLQASYTDFPYLGKTTEEIVKRDALIGVSITGMMDAPWIFDPNILSYGAGLVIETNGAIAKRIGINKAKRCTCIKPSGTTSLELGCVSSGIHPHHSKLYFRRIIANPIDPIVKEFIKINSHMIETGENGIMYILFPVESKGLTVNDVSTKNFIYWISLVYKNWVLGGDAGDHITHNVSCTVTVKPDEWDWIVDHVMFRNGANAINGMTFLPSLVDSKIPFCPRQAVISDDDIKKFNNLINKYRPVDYTKIFEDEDNTTKSVACDSESCSLIENYDDNETSADGYRIFEGRPVGDPSMIDSDLFEINELTFKVIKQFNDYFIAKRITNNK